MEIRDILEKVKSLNCPLVEITGGEPLIQDETPQLIKGLLDAVIQYYWKQTEAKISARLTDTA
jgi:organic radical activating enzyme